MAGLGYDPNRLERRAAMLADAMQHRIMAIGAGLRQSGSPPAFSQSMSRDRALDWWEKNWGQPAGVLALGGLDPLARLKLHNELSQRVAQRQNVPSIGNPLTSSQEVSRGDF